MSLIKMLSISPVLPGFQRKGDSYKMEARLPSFYPASSYTLDICRHSEESEFLAKAVSKYLLNIQTLPLSP
jgi:hypothetical protein